MALSAGELSEVASELHKIHNKELERLDPIREAVRGAVGDIYVPRSATAEYRRLVDQARFNVLPLVVGALTQSLYVDGFRPRQQEDNATVWDQVWQPNRMDARQAGLHRAAVQYGVAYALALPDRRPGAPSPVSITPYSPRQVTAMYDDTWSEWPTYVMVWGRKAEQGQQAWLYDSEQAYGLLVGESACTVQHDAQGDAMVRQHGVGFPPFVRYPDSYDDLDDGPMGKVWPLLSAQRQLNQTTFSLLMAQQYAAFRQRWVTGMAIPEDDQGQPIEPFNAAVNRVWQAESPDTRFGDFEQTDLRPYLESRDKMQLYIANMAQIPPHNMVVGPGISNISAEALAALEAGHRQDIAEHQATFGEAHEQLLRLSGMLMGDRTTWEDRSSEVVWRDTTPRSLGQIMDAWGKAVQMMGVPPEGAWEQLPVSDQTIKRWREASRERDAVAALDRIVNGTQTTGAQGAEPGGERTDQGAPV